MSCPCLCWAASAGFELLANTPVVAATLFVEGYLIIADLSPTGARPHLCGLATGHAAAFVAMMFAGTLGGNATLIGASANVVSVGICAAEGRPVSLLCRFHALRRAGGAGPARRRRAVRRRPVPAFTVSPTQVDGCRAVDPQAREGASRLDPRLGSRLYRRTHGRPGLPPLPRERSVQNQSLMLQSLAFTRSGADR